MMKNSSLVSFLVFICSLVIGYHLSTGLFPINNSLSTQSTLLDTKEASSTIKSMNNGQRSIFLINVSSVSIANPELISVWLATYLPAETSIHLIPVYPSGSNRLSDFDLGIQQTFGLTETNGTYSLSRKFTSYLDRNNYWWSGYLVFDQVMMNQVIDNLGNISVNGKKVSSQQAEDVFTGLINNPQNIYEYQLAIVQSACQELAESTNFPVWFNTSSVMSDHILTDMRLDQIMAEWEGLSTNGHNPSCIFPSLAITKLDQ